MQSKTQDGFQKEIKSFMEILKTASQLNHAKPGTLQTQELETNGLGKDTEVIAPPQERAQT